MGYVRNAAVAGMFYPATPEEMWALVDACWEDAPEWPGLMPRALIAPHAGFIYSGPTAACAYRSIEGASFQRV
ncbi:MAG: AmmeMemoRadiSam system protein B, partial [Zetaproteobacteria bacterium]